MLISEIFNSIDGEGIRAGYLVTFIRTFGCNLRCSYCDSMYALEGSNYQELTVDQVMKAVRSYPSKRITFTGGEPLLQKDAFDLVSTLVEEGYEVNIETNGSVDVSPFLLDHVIITMDWKCPSSGMMDRMFLDNMMKLRSTDVIKFVVGSEEDLNNMKDMYITTDAIPFVSPVFGKIEPKEIVYYLQEHNLQEVRFQLQLHKFVWPADMRGV